MMRVAWQQFVTFLGFGYKRSGSPEHMRVMWFPHWFLALIFAILPALRLRAILRTARRHRLGLCQHCGYDLRATPHGGRCPECGAPSTSKLSVES
jgi:hypothetical protein